MAGTEPRRVSLRENRIDAYARRIKHALFTFPRAFQGYRYGKRLTAEGLPAYHGKPNELERYFDEHTDGPGLWKWRHYFPVYERHFQKFVGREVHIVEIGVFSGGSLDMWKTYFGDGAHVYGVDIEPACKVYEGPRTRVFIGDQSDPVFWQRFLRDVPEFDIVIDDGGHEARQQIATLQALLPHLRRGGVYLCEDSEGRAHPFHAYIHGLSLNLHAMSIDEDEGTETTDFQSAIDSIHLYPYVSVIEKRTTRLDRLVAPQHGTEWQPFYEGVPDRAG